MTTTKPRLLFIISDLGPGGAQPINVWLARLLRNHGYPVRMVTLFQRPWFEPVDASSLEVIRLAVRKGVGKPFIPLRLSLLARQADIVIGGAEMAATNYGWLAASLVLRPFIAWNHTAFHIHQHSNSPLDRWVSLTIYKRLQWVVFPSVGALDSLGLALGRQPAGANWRVIENFLEEANKPPTKQPPDPAIFAKPVVLGIGRLAEEKAFDRLIRAHHKLYSQGLDHNLAILGEGPTRDVLELEARRLGVEQTVFLPGHVQDVSDWLAHASVFALCSKYEGFALVLLEALAAGVPAVAMDCPSGPAEILQNGTAGLLTPDGDEIAFQEALARLLISPELRALYADRGLERAKYYSPERIVPKWEQLFVEVLAASRK